MKKQEQIIELNINAGEFIAKMEVQLNANADIYVIVPPSCEGICVVDGTMSEVLSEGKNMVVSTGEKKGFWARLFSKKAVSPLVRIYCINKSVPLKGYWGTANKIEFRERETGIPVSAGLCGSYKATVNDSAMLLRNLLGLGKSLDAEAIDTYFSAEIGASVRDKFYKIVTGGNVPFFELAGNLNQLADLIKADMEGIFAESGLRLSGFIVENVGLDDDVKQMVRDYAVKAYNKRMNQDEILEQREIEQRTYDDAKEREMWLRKETSASRTQRAEIEYARAVSQSKPEKDEASAQKERFCSECGAHVPAGARFCAKCGAKQRLVCSCGYEAVRDEKFCPNCGNELK